MYNDNDNDIINIYNIIIQKRERTEQIKREKIIKFSNNSNKSFDENKFRKNLKNVKENLKNV